MEKSDNEKSFTQRFNELSDEQRKEIIDSFFFDKVKVALKKIKAEKEQKKEYQFIIWAKGLPLLILLFDYLYKAEYIIEPEYPINLFVPIFHFRDSENKLFNIGEFPEKILNDIRNSNKKIENYFIKNFFIDWKESQPLFISFIFQLYEKKYIINPKRNKWDLFCAHFKKDLMKPDNLRSVLSQKRVTDWHKNKIESDIFNPIDDFIQKKM